MFDTIATVVTEVSVSTLHKSSRSYDGWWMVNVVRLFLCHVDFTGISEVKRTHLTCGRLMPHLNVGFNQTCDNRPSRSKDHCRTPRIACS